MKISDPDSVALKKSKKLKILHICCKISSTSSVVLYDVNRFKLSAESVFWYYHSKNENGAHKK